MLSDWLLFLFGSSTERALCRASNRIDEQKRTVQSHILCALYFHENNSNHVFDDPVMGYQDKEKTNVNKYIKLEIKAVCRMLICRYLAIIQKPEDSTAHAYEFPIKISRELFFEFHFISKLSLFWAFTLVGVTVNEENKNWNFYSVR